MNISRKGLRHRYQVEETWSCLIGNIQQKVVSEMGAEFRWPQDTGRKKRISDLASNNQTRDSVDLKQNENEGGK